MSEPEPEEEIMKIRRTGSGGLLMRKKPYEEQEAISRARAMELSSLYETSDNGDTSLNKQGEFNVKTTKYKHAPNLNTVSPKHAAVMFQKQQDAYTINDDTSVTNPLLTEHEIKEQEQKELQEKRKVAIKKRKSARGGTTTLASVSGKPHLAQAPQQSPLERSVVEFQRNQSYDETKTMLAETGLEETRLTVAATSTAFSCAPNPFAVQQLKKYIGTRPRVSGYKASNGKVYYVESLC